MTYEGTPAVWKLPPLRRGFNAPPDITEKREQVARHAALPDQAMSALYRTSQIGGVRCLEVGRADADTTILYFHGGSYRAGDPQMWTGLAATLVGGESLRVVLPDYRLAPEHPFPAAIYDAAAVYGALSLGGQPPVLAGDSAGGGLASSLTLAADQSGTELPPGVILLSPLLDLRIEAESYDTNAGSDQVFSRAGAEEARLYYLQGADPSDPLASPLLGNLDRFPPVQIFCGTDEVLLDDALSFVSRLTRARRSVEVHLVSGMPHVWPMLLPDDPESAKLRTHMIRFAQERGASRRS